MPYVMVRGNSSWIHEVWELKALEDGNIDGAVPVSSILTLNKNVTVGPLLIQAAPQATSLFTMDSFFVNKDCSLHPFPAYAPFLYHLKSSNKQGSSEVLFSGA